MWNRALDTGTIDGSLTKNNGVSARLANGGTPRRVAR